MAQNNATVGPSASQNRGVRRRAAGGLLAWASALGALGGLAAAGCRHAEIPYDLGAIVAPPAPIHPERLAVLPFTDARSEDEGTDDAPRFVYRGIELEHTDLDALPGWPLDRVTELVARHLAAARTFAQVILVRSAADAPEADLVLEGRVRRMRGYVEAEPPTRASGRPEDERLVLAEVLLADVVVRQARPPGATLAALDAGWSLEDRRSTAAGSIDPWAVLGAAFQRAVSDLAAELAAADLSGRHIVRTRVRLEPGDRPGDLATLVPPEGWRVAATSTASTPIGWRAAPRCASRRLEAEQTLRFHRVLGPYRPQVAIWSCPRGQRLTFDALEEFPATYLGRDPVGAAVFARQVGASNWPGALAELGAYLGLEPPAARYTFEVGP